MEFPETRSVRAGFWAVVLLGIFAWAPATYPGYWQSLQGFVPVFNVAQPSSIAGIAVDADLWRGTGSATFLLVQPFLLLGSTPVMAVRILFILIFILGGLGTYVWLRPAFGDRAAGLSGLTYMLLPTVLATVYIRGNAADAMVVALLPLALAGAGSYASTRSASGAGVLIISLLWIWRSQAGLAIFATLLLLLYALLVERQFFVTMIVGVTGVAGLISLFPLRSFQVDPTVLFHEHYVHLFQLLNNSWQVAASEPGWQDQYPFQLGLIALAFSLIAFWLWRMQPIRTPAGTTRLLWFAYAGVVIGVLFTLQSSRLLWQVTGADRLLTYPWQILLIAAPLLAATAGSLAVVAAGAARLPYWLGLATLIVLGSYPFLSTDYTQVVPPDRPLAVIGPANNLVVLGADLTESEDGSEANLAVTWQVLHPLPFDYNIFLQALRDENGTPIVIAQLDSPPLADEQPVTSWRSGEIFSTTYRLALPDAGDGAATPLRYYFGYYDWRDGARLPVDSGLDDKMVFYGR